MILNVRRPLRPGLPPLPQRMASLPVDERGFPVPYFVAWRDDKPVFEAADPEKYQKCVQQDRCWLCGERLGRYRAFVIGPMCVVNRVSAEPPSHLECAEFAAQACPFLTRPLARRAEVPEGSVPPGGEMIQRNPGAVAVWVTTDRGYSFFVPRGSRMPLVQLDAEPTQIHAWAHGRPLQWEALMESLDSGLPLLEDMCRSNDERAALAAATRLARKTIDRFWVKRPSPGVQAGSLDDGVPNHLDPDKRGFRP